MGIAEGKAHTFQDYAKRLETLKSKHGKPSNDKPIKADGYELYTTVRADGFTDAVVTFINLTDNEQRISSYFKPLRKDVQPLGFDAPDWAEYENYKKEFLSLLGYILKYIGYIGPGDLKTIDENPDRIIAILKAFLCRRNAYNMTERKFGRNGVDDISDAFRHAYLNAIMTRDVGYDFAKEIADNHELNPDRKGSMEMDLWNNEVGRELGLKLKERGIEDDDSYAEEILNQIDRLIHELQRDD